ncbi:hypothetical protein CRT60_01175 [Azospirillum palustre]|uniref:Uncharacterized protein n=1 Tax=Azospirillum palustre TaxID=2044885 RepID=A0A2B8BD48_9PROT|nr:hypothetical protein [Azospirillum palustre]PGH59274.1 hypothetical protein CRT60_01175 [Azospirillum palustre]
MTETDRLLARLTDDVERDFVAALAPFIQNAHGGRRSLQWPTPMAYLLSHGQFWAPVPLPASIVHGEPTACFANAWKTVQTQPDLRYAEGYGYDPDLGIPIEHAWCIDSADRVLDPTWRDATRCRYFGAIFPSMAVVQIHALTGVFGVLDGSTWRSVEPLLEAVAQQPKALPVRGA